MIGLVGEVPPMNATPATFLFEEDADGGFDAVLVDAWGHVLDRAYGRDRLQAEAALLAKLATAPTTDWL